MADADTSIGTARLDIVVDTSQFDTAINQARRSVSDMSQAAQDAYNKMSASQRRQVDSLIKQADQLNLTRSQQIAYNATLKNVPTSILDELKTKLAAAEQGTEKLGMSARATAAAMRQVPAQVTDILVGLQGGQKPLTVLLQQGGQLKDMFGGVVPAARALGTTVLGLVSPFTLAAGAAAALLLAYKSGGAEATEFNKQLILTGNSSGQTAQSLSDLAHSISQAGVSQGNAAKVLTQVVASGKIASDAYREVAEAAIDLEKLTGAAANTTIAVFEKLADEPTKASAALNDQYHYLTASVYEQIAALERQGDKDEASALAQRTFANALVQRTAEIKANMGTLERAWNSLGAAAKSAWDAMLNIGRPTPIADLKKQAQALQDQIAALQGGTGFESNAEGAAFGRGRNARVQAVKHLQAQLAPILQQIADDEKKSAEARAAAELQSTNDAKIAAQTYIDNLRQSTRSRKQIRDDEIAQVKKNAETLGLTAKQTQALIDQVNAKYKDPATKAFSDTAATKLLQQYREAEASLTAQIVSQEKLGTWAQKQAEFEEQVADLKNKKILTADQKSILANQDALRTQLDRNVALEKEGQSKQANLRLTALQQSLEATMRADQQKYGGQEAALGLGSKQQQRLTEQSSIYRDYQRQLAQVANNRTTGKIGDDEYQQQTDALRAALGQRLALQQEHFAQIDKLQGSWELGFQSAYADYVDSAQNYYAQAGDIFKSVTGGMEDAFANFVKTGKLDFKSLADSIIADLARIAAKQAIVGVIGSIAGAFTSGLTADSGVSATGSATTQNLDGLSGTWSSVAGARASGGDVSPNSLYQVNELGPELFSQRGKTYLMSGADGGYVTPLKQSAAAGAAAAQGTVVNLQVNYTSDGQQTQQGQGDEFSNGLRDVVKQYVQQEIARSWKPGGSSWNARNGRAAA